MRHWLRMLLVGGLAAGAPAAGQAPEPGPARAGARVVGVVLDSLAGGVPLAGAHVQLVAAGGTHDVVRSADSDAEGRFVLDSVPEGRYRLGFLHPALDSMGLEPPVRAVVVSGPQQVYVDLFTPSPARYRTAVCGARAGEEAPALLTGIVRRASDQLPVDGAIVTGEWLELVIGRGIVGRRLAGATDTTGASGWFALCGVPQQGTVVVAARHGADGTDRIEAEIPTGGFVKRDLYLGEARAEQASTGALQPTAGDTAAGTAARRRGDGRLRGTVVTAEGGRPIAGAQVAIVGGPVTTSDARGEWTLSGIPTGTRELQVRAIGHAPRSLTVDVVPGAPPVRVALSATQAVLDTVRVRADRGRLEQTGFSERRRTGMGRYLTAEELARRPLLVTSDALQNVPGIRVDRTTTGETALSMRSPFGYCTPTVFIDGMDAKVRSADDLDAWVAPQNVVGIEVYAGTAVPPQFHSDSDTTGCGSIAIWTRTPTRPAKR